MSVTTPTNSSSLQAAQRRSRELETMIRGPRRVPSSHRRPPDRAAAHRAPVRHAAQPGPPAEPRRRSPGAHRGLPGPHRSGARALKETLTEALNERLRPMWARRQKLARDPGYLRGVLTAGNERARDLADTTLRAVQNLMHANYTNYSMPRRY
jgi:hypothetical protein